MAEGAGQTLGTDWGIIGAAIAFLGIVVGAGITLVLYQHGQLLAQIEDEKDRCRIREKLKTDAGIARRFRDGIDGLTSRIDSYFGPRRSWRAFDRCLLHAYLYPILLFVAAWVAGAGGTLGTIPLLAEVGVWQRLGVFAVLVLIVGFVFLVVASIARVECFLRPGIRRALDLASSAIGRSALTAERPIAKFLAFSLPFAVSVAVPILGTIAFDFAFSTAFASTFTFTGTLAFLAAGAGAGAGAGAAAGVVGYAVLVVRAGYLEMAATLFMFCLALPIANGFLDWVSWAWTRWLLRAPIDGDGATRGAAAIGGRLFVDLGLAFVSLCLLALLLPNVVEGTNRIFSWLGMPTIAWLPLLNQALEAPLTLGLFVTGMLLTTLVPTLLHVAAGLFGVFAVWGGGGAAMAARIPADPAGTMTTSDRQAVAWFLLRRRLWLIPATIVTGLLVVPFAWMLSLWIGPIGLFLADLALCGTSWSHGLCPFVE